LKVTSGTTSKYFLTDHLGSTVGLADSNGAVVESATYDSFGRIQSNNLSTRYGYTGRELDETTGLMFYRARFYDPQVGRFISEDPIGFDGGINWYAYVGNQSIKYKDPRGLDSPGADAFYNDAYKKRKSNPPSGVCNVTDGSGCGIEFLPDHQVVGAKWRPFIEQSIRDMVNDCECQKAFNDAGLNLPAVWNNGIVIGSATLITDNNYTSLQLRLTDAERDASRRYVNADNAFTIMKPAFDSRPKTFINTAAYSVDFYEKPGDKLRGVLAHELIHAAGQPGVKPYGTLHRWFGIDDSGFWGYVGGYDDLHYFNPHYRNILKKCAKQ
jgi:RHS repeat-associated protein